MSRTLIVLDTNVDRLWRNVLPGIAPDGKSKTAVPAEIIDLKTNRSNPTCPYYHDPVNWRRWLDKHLVDKLHLFLPGNRSHIFRTFVNHNIEVNLHITGALTPATWKSLALTQDNCAGIVCAGKFIARQLRQEGIDPNKMTVAIPQVNAAPTPARRRRQIRRQLQNKKTGPILLALNSPQNAPALKQLIWAVALAGHLIPQMTLVITGPYSDCEKNRILKWRNMMDVEKMVYLEPEQINWNDLVSACDAVIAGPNPTNEIIRLCWAQTLNQHIIAPRGWYDEYLDNYPKTHYASTPEPRPLAQTLVRFLDNTTKI